MSGTANHAALAALGWDDGYAALAADGLAAGRVPARVVSEERGAFQLHDGNGVQAGVVTGRLRHESQGDPLAFPAVGDWVLAERPDTPGVLPIHALLPRRTAVVRRAPSDHGTGSQIVAANVDVAFVVTSLNAELKLRRLERYLAVAWESGATPVIVLSKADLDADPAGHRAAVDAVAVGVEVIATSAVSGAGIDAVRAHLRPGRTVVFMGSSGVGKSTLVNALAGEELLVTSAIREDDARGRHTTTRRQLVPLADGLVIDTPGMREMGLLDGDGIGSAFDDIESVAAGCRFRDCRHQTEPGCAIRAALAGGTLDAARLQAYRKLEREAHRAELATDAVARKAARRRWTAVTRAVGREMDRNYGVGR